MSRTAKESSTDLYYDDDLYAQIKSYRLARKALKDMGATASFADPDILGLTRALETGWKGASYSTRVWSNVERLAATLSEEVTAAFLSGKSNARIAELITERFGSSYREAERLVRTETSYVHNQAALHSYRDARLEEYEYLTAHDSRTCKVRGAMDGKRFALAEAEVGVNMPPMHPNCRCTVVPVVDSALSGLTEDEARAWGADGAPEDVQGWLKKRREDGILMSQGSDGMLERQQNGAISEVKGRSFDDYQREMANGLRQPCGRILTDEDIALLKDDIRAIGADESVFLFNEGTKTAYFDDLDVITVHR